MDELKKLFQAKRILAMILAAGSDKLASDSTCYLSDRQRAD